MIFFLIAGSLDMDLHLKERLRQSTKNVNKMESKIIRKNISNFNVHRSYLIEFGEFSADFCIFHAWAEFRNGEYWSTGSKSSNGGVEQLFQHFCWTFIVRGLSGGGVSRLDAIFLPSQSTLNHKYYFSVMQLQLLQLI